jgi:phosphoglycolate phosphatase-like HAD superfamily hydrolase
MTAVEAVTPQAPQTWATWVFDCDGVILDSNRIKTEAFREVALPYGDAAAQALVAFHVAHGGVSRYAKFAHFLSHILGRGHAPEPEVAALAAAYGEQVYLKLLDCPMAEGLAALRAACPGAGWMVVSGSDQAELRRVFAARGLDALFDQGIYGSPANKDEILARELATGTIKQPALFVGDSRYDHEAATRAGLHFVFASRWSEFHEWPQYCAAHHIPVVAGVAALREQA